MSTKRFCDCCSKPMSRKDEERITAKSGRIAIEVLVAVDGVWNGGDACHDCIRKVFNGGKPKRKAKP